MEKIRTQGITAYNRVINGHRNFEFVMFISSLADAIDNFSIARATGLVEDSRLAAASTQRRKATNKNSVLEEKITKFYEELEKRGYAGSRQQLCLTNVPRVNIAKSVCRAINKAPAHILQKCKMKVTFDSEEGLDFSGPLREMFYLVSKETFDPYRGYFKYASDNQYTVAVASQICSPNGELDSETKAWFRFSGRLIGLALLHRVLLDVYFVRSFYRALLKQSYKLEDLKSMDEEFYNSMSWILKNEIDDKYLCMTFEADTEIFGQLITRELKPGGTEIDVTDANKIEYRVFSQKCREGGRQQLKKGQNDLKLHVLTQKRLKITLFNPKITSNDRVFPQNKTFQGKHPVHRIVDKMAYRSRNERGDGRDLCGIRRRFAH